MKLWLLQPKDGLPEDNNPWIPWYDKAFGFVIRAESEDSARRIANDNAGDETRCESWHEIQRHPWLDPEYSTCDHLTDDGPEEMVIVDFLHA